MRIFTIVKGKNLQKNEAYKFYRFAFFFLVFVLFRWFGIYLIDLFRPIWLTFELQFSFWLMDFTTFFFLGYRKVMAPGKYGLKVTSPLVQDNLSQDLLNELEQNKPFLNVQFNRGDLAQKLHLSEERISALLNQELGTTFYELVNRYRVKEAKTLLDTGVGKNLTMEAIARQAGFKSKTTFYKFFKSEFGMNPSDYIKHQHSN